MRAWDRLYNIGALKAVPQKPITVYELLLYAVIPFILIMAGAMPTTALVLLPISLPLLYLLYRRFGPYLPVSIIVCYAVLSLSLNYDILTVVYSIALFVAFVGLIAAMQFSPYLMSVAVAAICAAVGALAGVGTVRLIEGKPIADIAQQYVLSESADPVISYLARDYYDGKKLESGEVRLDPSDPDYYAAAIESFSEWARDELEYYFWYYCIHYGTLAAYIGFFIAVVINRRTSCCYDADANEQLLRLSTRALGGARVSGPIADMKMPRAYLWTMAIPATVVCMILGFVGDYSALAATFMHTFIVLPCAFGCFTLFAYFVSLFSGKGRVAATVVLTIVGIAAVAMPIVLFALSILGVCDCILNLRFWTNFINKD